MSEAAKQPFLYWIEKAQFFPVSIVKNYMQGFHVIFQKYNQGKKPA